MLSPLVVESINAGCEVKSVNCEVFLWARDLSVASVLAWISSCTQLIASCSMLCELRVVASVSDNVVSFRNGLMHFGYLHSAYALIFSKSEDDICVQCGYALDFAIPNILFGSYQLVIVY